MHTESHSTFYNILQDDRCLRGSFGHLWSRTALLPYQAILISRIDRALAAIDGLATVLHADHLAVESDDPEQTLGNNARDKLFLALNDLARRAHEDIYQLAEAYPELSP